MIKRIIYVIIFSFVLASCQQTITTPVKSSWPDYKPEYLVKNEIEQGPYADHQSMYWEAKEKGTFTGKGIIKMLGEKGDFELGDSIFISKAQLANADNPRKAEDNDYALIKGNNYPRGYQRWIDEDMWMYRFVSKETNPASKSAIVKCFAIINIDGTKFTLLR